MTPLVDVVIAARNESTFLARALDALRRQTYDPNRLAIYVVDSNSTDATAEIALGAGVTVLRESKPGAAAARNRGIRQGQGELIAFLDAHCLPNPEWVATMVYRFSDWRLGGCQGRIDNRSTDARVQAYLASSGAFANERVIEDTVSGKRNLYPWILSGNSMFRRSAVEGAGLFEEALQACEDVDLAWRIFLLGYQLGYEPQAEVVHYDLNTWHRFVRKGAVYGAGAASLAQAYGAHGASNKFAPPPLWSRSAERTLAIAYSLVWVTTVSGRDYDSALPGHSLPDRSVRFVTSSGQRLRGRMTARCESVRASFSGFETRSTRRLSSIQRLGFGGCWNLSRTSSGEGSPMAHPGRIWSTG